jgi:PqqD family protein of HPr-rel-A system
VIYRLAEGVRVEPLGNTWASFSSCSGETLLLNTEAAAVLELLSGGPADSSQIARTLAMDSETGVADVDEALRHVWDRLLSAGLIEPASQPT